MSGTHGYRHVQYRATVTNMELTVTYCNPTYIKQHKNVKQQQTTTTTTTTTPPTHYTQYKPRTTWQNTLKLADETVKTWGPAISAEHNLGSFKLLSGYVVTRRNIWQMQTFDELGRGVRLCGPTWFGENIGDQWEEKQLWQLLNTQSVIFVVNFSIEDSCDRICF